MAERLKDLSTITPDDALAALRWFVATRKLSVAQVSRALRDREAFLSEVNAKLEAFAGEGLRFLGPASFQKRPRRRAKKASAKARAAWKAQGRYLAAVRRLSKADRVKVRAIRRKNGVRAAIAEAKRVAKG